MNNEYLRHTLATINYRFQKSVRNAEDSFGGFSLGKGSRSTNEIIHHMYDVLSATRFFIEREQRKKGTPERLSLTLEIERFIAELKTLDKTLSDKELGIDYSKRLLQGPFSDILTHIGQISMLQRLNDGPIEREDFSSVDIKTGVL
ncbi:hypothetical protein FNH22_00355 [Fulvivirga sp. M361]|uniref:hypothetical protein n=1 Tax=Fulvivirga sp. M361 TaxID=2594266 RepID=UPI00117B559D|nr:hypothetical protein [Fulvivirga sp. M361]TRX62581.1 hypothetical protein FNH22_00355 [Fulvivirga sp. M361]